MDILKILLTASLSVAALFIIAKIMGHKQVAQLDFFDYISGITIGSIAAELATELEEPWKPLIALAVYGSVSVIFSLLSAKLSRSRKYLNGTPTILMNGGKIFRENLKQAKLDLSEFLLLCREQGYFDLQEIETAVFEHNGKLSVLPASEKRPLTPSDVNIQPQKAHIGTEVIMDGRIMGENLTRMGRDAKWLQKELRAKGFSSAEKILLGIYCEGNGSLALYPM